MKSTHLLEQTDPSVLSFIYNEDESNEINYDEDYENNDVFSHGQRRMSEILKAKLQRSNSILEPEKINEQVDYLDDLVEEVDDENEEEYNDNEDDAAIISDSVRNMFWFFFYILRELEKRMTLWILIWLCYWTPVQPAYEFLWFHRCTSVHLLVCQFLWFWPRCARG